MITPLVVVIASCFILGLLIPLLTRAYLKKRTVRWAKFEAEQMVDEARQEWELFVNTTKEEASEAEDETIAQFEKEQHKWRKRINELANHVRDKEQGFQMDLQKTEDQWRHRDQEVHRYKKAVNVKESRYEKLSTHKTELYREFVNKLSLAAETPAEEFTLQLSSQLIEQAKTMANKIAQEVEDDMQTHGERNAKRIIATAINRFARPYCSERGLGYITLPNEQMKKKLVGPDYAHIAFIEKTCGVDLIINDEHNTISVSGFDPVRRELGRATIEKLVREKHITQERIQQLIEKTKKDLFRKIRQDGNRLANELKLQNLHPEIRNKMGSLRYRYSFTQNQYYHCAEVGFLCGLLSSELRLSIEQGRRAGMLHDIGKSMDHSIDGGHAVIGADFIQQHGEDKKIVHAVRAHHFDEQPSTELAYLVIAADAISGARPGARRSTAESYIQKMGQLEEIGNRFDGVKNTFVLSAGREVRIIVDSHRINDQRALHLSQEIASAIESECNYPGVIKVTVVRQSQAVEVAK